MEKARITFLGTGSHIPTKKHNHTAILLTYKNENILVDCGEGTQRQFKIADISPTKISKILITHWHGDHILGLPGLLQTLAMLDYNKTLKLYGPKGTKRNIETLKNLIKIKIPLEIHEIHQEKTIDEKEFSIEALPMDHGKPALAYSFTIKEKKRLNKSKIKKLKLPNSPLLGKLQKGQDIKHKEKTIKASQVIYTEPSRKISFILDTSPNKNTIKISKSSDLLICESSFSKEKESEAREYKHLTATDAATIAKKSKTKQLILTHISQRYEHKQKIILEEAKKVFKNTSIAKDFDTIEI